MKLHILFILFLYLTTFSYSQTAICYSNCREGYCNPTNPNLCTDCDPGMIISNNACRTTNVQNNPLKLYEPIKNNSELSGTNGNFFPCQISYAQNLVTNMLFRPILGFSFTQLITIPQTHTYVGIKFNAIIISNQNIPDGGILRIAVNIVPNLNRRQYLYSQIKDVNVSQNTLSCVNNTNFNRNKYYGVFFFDIKFMSSQSEINIIVQPQGLSDAYLGISSLQTVYGNCHRTCSTCLGPTQLQCTGCKGLLTVLTLLNGKGGSCGSCPDGFYQDIICKPCPSECQICVKSTTNNTIQCKKCYNVSANLTDINCKIASFYDRSLQFNNVSTISTSKWLSSQQSAYNFSECGDYKFYGGVDIGVANSNFKYSIAGLPTHTKVYIYFRMLLIDQTIGDNYTYSIELDNKIQTKTFVIQTKPGMNLTNECGQSSLQYYSVQNFTFDHEASSASLTINILKNYMGISNFLFVVNNITSDPNCLALNNQICVECRNGLMISNGTCNACMSGYYKTILNNLPYCAICPFNCLTCQLRNNNSIPCTSCKPPMILMEIYCVDANNSLFATQMVQNVPPSLVPNNWIFYPNLQNKGLSTCGGDQIIGNSEISYKFLSMKKRFTNLPSHSGVQLYFDLYQIDDQYFSDGSLQFVLNKITYDFNKTIPNNFKNVSKLKMSFCGNDSTDSLISLSINDQLHNDVFIDFQVKLNRMGKIGIKNIYLFVLLTGQPTQLPFQIQTSPQYSVDPIPEQGLKIKLNFPAQFKNTTSIDNIFSFNIKQNNTNPSFRLLSSSIITSQLNYVQKQQNYIQRMLQTSFSFTSPNTNNSAFLSSVTYLLNLNKTLPQSQLSIRAINQTNIYFTYPSNNFSLINQLQVSKTVCRFDYIGLQSSLNRAAIRNIYKFFRGCAIIGLFLGIASFIFGMSSCFDDFFVLCQIIFVHGFIQFTCSPPSVRIPFSGLHIVQFLQWLPEAARTGIQQAIIPNNLNQFTPIIYQQYYQDIVFARTIYMTLLFVGLVIGIWFVIHIALIVYNSNNPFALKNQPKSQIAAFFAYYYNFYINRKLAYVQKCVRFCYFTICWACMLQFISLSNSPTSFNVWNSILTIVMAIFVILYPPIMLIFLYRLINTMSAHTFKNSLGQQFRIQKDYIWYYIFRYYKLLVIAITLSLIYKNDNGYIACIVLMFINLVDGLILFIFKPLPIEKKEAVNAIIFYPYYPIVYYILNIIQQALFILFQIMFISLSGSKENASADNFIKIGYAITIFAILLIVNGLVRLLFGFLRTVQYCHQTNQSNYMRIDRNTQQQYAVSNQQKVVINSKRV